MSARSPAHRWSLARLVARPALAALALAGALGTVAGAAHADRIAWKQTHFVVGQEGTMFLRRGAAFFASGEVATLEVRGARGQAQAGVQPFDVYLIFRFDDGSTLNARLQGGIERDDYGGVGSQWGQGEFAGGTGRWQGASGHFTMNGRGGLMPGHDGAMADVAAECSGSVTLAGR